MTPREQPKRDATVADIARIAKVSKATAARALGAYGPVSDAVRDRVLAAAEELNYRPNALAKSMNTGKSNTIGVVIGDIENPFFGRAMRGISDVAKLNGFDVILSNSDENVEAERAAVDLLLDKRVDGLIVAPASSIETEHLQAVHKSGRPIVLLDRRADGADLDAMTVDNRAAAADAAAALLDAGHRRIAFISTIESDDPVFAIGQVLSSSTVRDRVHGLLEALTEAGITEPERYIRLDARRRGVAPLVRSLLMREDPATAIMASDSLVALSVLQALSDLGLAVPRDVSLVAFDNPDWASITTPPLTVVAQPIYELGAAAARAVVEQIAGRRDAPRASPFETELIHRESIGAVAPEPVVDGIAS
jgi:LacI family transcriptional regulator, galactose operon repressor